MDLVLKAQERDLSVKGVTLRNQGFVPGCIYGHEFKSTPIQIAYTDLWKAVHSGAIKCEVKYGNKTQLVAIEEIQKNPKDGKYVHVSFHALKSNEKTWMHIPIHFKGESLGKKAGGIVSQQMNEVYVYGYPKDIPDELVFDISGLELDSSFHVSDMVKGYKFEVAEEDLEKTVVVCHYAKVQSDEPDTTETEPEVVGEEKAVEENKGETKAA